MKLRMLALFAIFAVSAWLPYAAQQTSAHQAAPQSQAPPTSPAPHKDPANPTCACCDPALHGSTPAANLHAEACCHGHEVTSTTCCHHDNNDTKPARSCCHARNANACSSRDRTSCCASNGSPAAAAARGLAISGMTKLAVPPEPGSAPSPLTENNFHNRARLLMRRAVSPDLALQSFRPSTRTSFSSSRFTSSSRACSSLVLSFSASFSNLKFCRNSICARASRRSDISALL